jgi:hypothetical protein
LYLSWYCGGGELVMVAAVAVGVCSQVQTQKKNDQRRFFFKLV